MSVMSSLAQSGIAHTRHTCFFTTHSKQELDDEDASSDGQPRRSKRKRQPLSSSAVPTTTLPSLHATREGALLASTVFGQKVLEYLPEYDKGARISH